MPPVSLIVMEQGSAWPAHIDDLTNVVGLSPVGGDLLRRTMEKLDAFRRRDQSLRVAILACSDVTDADAVRDRTALARTLLAGVKLAIHGRLVLSAGDGASRQLRAGLLTLAGELSDELRRTSASVSLLFTEPPHAQGGPTLHRSTTATSARRARGSPID